MFKKYFILNFTTSKSLVIKVIKVFNCEVKSNTPSWVFFTFFKMYEWY